MSALLKSVRVSEVFKVEKCSNLRLRGAWNMFTAVVFAHVITVLSCPILRLCDFTLDRMRLDQIRWKRWCFHLPERRLHSERKIKKYMKTFLSLVPSWSQAKQVSPIQESLFNSILILFHDISFHLFSYHPWKSIYSPKETFLLEKRFFPLFCHFSVYGVKYT